MADKGGRAGKVIDLVDLEEERLNNTMVLSMADNTDEPAGQQASSLVCRSKTHELRLHMP
ncbi:hypothetical protein TIFTF001_054374 [Ficus carica]|uniref:Uncharacterized protein n=1 Tax=Ficus carica TaxID=3494 RepID=A0AA88EH51_FICCA|nr:hypothetical protein TIFTF001_054374 [Ficus carica]